MKSHSYTTNYSISVNGVPTHRIDEPGLDHSATELRRGATNVAWTAKEEFMDTAHAVKVISTELDETFLLVANEDGRFKWVREKTSGLFDSLYDAMRFADPERA